uniref:Protein ALP1-like n=1 Tax=Tanacetum cinerariifolium TaxID=118510 RepID=A0A6L2MDV2_TANCI|nr:hypothetical protein [Tanacetum cinerariifolium]
MNSYTFMGIDLEEVISRKKTFIKRVIEFIKRRQRANRLTRNNINRDRSGAHERLVPTSFSEDPMYGELKFRKTFRMAHPLFNEIVTAVIDHDRFFRSNMDCAGRQCISRTSRTALDHFCQAVMEIYGPKFLRKPTVTDIEKLYLHHEEKHGFSRMLGSLDCTDWEWFGCPYAFKAHYVRRDHGLNPFIFLEAVASQDLWIWHAIFGVAGSNNDINVLYQSPLFNDLKTGRALEIPFVANGVTYESGYSLVDGIYPELTPLVKTIPEPVDDDHKRILYKQKHESARKDVERAFDSDWLPPVLPPALERINQFLLFGASCLPAERSLGSGPNSSWRLSSSIGSAAFHLGIVMENVAVVMVMVKNIVVEYFLDSRNFRSRMVVVDDTPIVIDKLVQVTFAFQKEDTIARKNLSFVNLGVFDVKNVLKNDYRGLGFKPRREGFLSGAKKEWGLSPKANVRVLHTAQLDVTISSNH